MCNNCSGTCTPKLTSHPTGNLIPMQFPFENHIMRINQALEAIHLKTQPFQAQGLEAVPDTKAGYPTIFEARLAELADYAEKVNHSIAL